MILKVILFVLFVFLVCIPANCFKHIGVTFQYMMRKNFFEPHVGKKAFLPPPCPGKMLWKTSPLEWLKLHFQPLWDLKTQCIYFMLLHLRVWFKYVLGLLVIWKISHMKFKNAWHFDIMLDSVTLCCYAWQLAGIRMLEHVCDEPFSLKICRFGRYLMLIGWILCTV